MNLSNNPIYLVFKECDENLLGKDVFLVPYYLGKVKQQPVYIINPRRQSNKKMPYKIRGVQFKRINKYLPDKFFGKRSLTFFILRRAWKMKFLMLFHLSIFTLPQSVIYKFLNPKGFLYIKADINLDGIIHFNNYLEKRKIRKWFWKYVFKRLDALSVETIDVLEYVQHHKIAGMDLSKKVKFVPNGFDEEMLQSFHIKEKTFQEKENIFLVVGRLGIEPKNTEMILEATKKVDFKNWKIQFIGPLEKKEQDFEKYANDFFKNNPHLKNNIEFLGAIYNKKILFEHYNRSKVFLLPSRRESFGIVLNEASRFTNYIVATDVGGVKDTLKMMNNYGQIIPQEDSNSLAIVMQDIIDERIHLDEKFRSINRSKIIQQNSWEFILKNAGI